MPKLAVQKSVMPNLILLPGMDGTSDLFAPLLNTQLAAHAGIAMHCISYPPSQVLNYPALRDYVMRKLPANGPLILLGESFSGPIAISVASELARKTPGRVLGLVLCCTFTRNPLPLLAGLNNVLPWLPIKATPTALMAQFLFGTQANPSLTNMLRLALQKVSNKVLQSRLQEVLQVDVSAELAQLSQLAYPILYLRAKHDRLVPASAANAIQRIAPHTEISTLPGPHCLLQTNSQSASDIIRQFIDKLNAPNARPNSFSKAQ